MYSALCTLVLVLKGENNVESTVRARMFYWFMILKNTKTINYTKKL